MWYSWWECKLVWDQSETTGCESKKCVHFLNGCQKPCWDCFGCLQIAKVAHRLFGRHQLLCRHSATLQVVVKLHKQKIENVKFYYKVYADELASSVQTTDDFGSILEMKAIASTLWLHQSLRPISPSYSQEPLANQSGNAHVFKMNNFLETCTWRYARNLCRLV